MDFSVFKNFGFKERYNARFRVELLNIFNHPIISKSVWRLESPWRRFGWNPGTLRSQAAQSDIVYLMRVPKVALLLAALGARTSGPATVFGAPGDDSDEMCSNAGIAKVSSKLK